MTPWDIREHNKARWKPHGQEKPGDCHYNVHHNLYQAILEPTGKLFVVEPRHVEITDAQFETWVERVRQARALARRGMEPDAYKLVAYAA